MSTASKRTVTVVCDNGGGITVMLRGYSHYGDAGTVADVLVSLIGGGPGADPSGWDGHDPDARMVYDSEVERNGGYRWYSGTVREVVAAIKRDADCGWGNVRDLAAALSVGACVIDGEAK